MPGIGDLRQQYRFLAPHVAAAGFTVVSMDVRGLGESSAGWSDYSAAATGSDMLALIQELDAGPAHLVGNSSAAGSAVWVAAEAPERVASLTLIGPFVRDIPPRSPLQPLLVWGTINVGLARPWGVGVWGTYYTSLYPTSKPHDMDAYVQPLEPMSKSRAAWRPFGPCSAVPNRTSRPVSPRVQTQTLVVMGSKDPTSPRRWRTGRRGASGRRSPARQRADGRGRLPLPARGDAEKVAPAIVHFLEQARG